MITATKQKLIQTSLLKKGRRVVLKSDTIFGIPELKGVISESWSRRTATCKVLTDNGRLVEATRYWILKVF